MNIGVLTRLAKYFPAIMDLLGEDATRVIRHTPSGGGAVTRNLLDRLDEVITYGDYVDFSQAQLALMSKPNSFFLTNRQTFTLTVGPGGTFTTLNAAIDAAARMRPRYKRGNSYCIIQLKSGFVMAEQLLIAGKTDLGWIKIVSEDTFVPVTSTSITIPLSALDDVTPIFGAIEQSTLPVIGCRFQYPNNSTSKDGVAVLDGSKVSHAHSRCGVRYARRGLVLIGNAEAHCFIPGLTQGGDGIGAQGVVGVDYSYARIRGCHIAYGSRASLPRSDFSHCNGDYGVYTIWGSYGNLYQSNASYATNGTAFNARDGSFLDCRECNGARSKRAFHALHNSRINARSRLTGATMIWIGEGAQYCTEYGVLASGNSHIEAAELNASYCTGSAGVSASDSSGISFYSAKAVGCRVRGVWCQRASNISAYASDMSDCQYGILCDGGFVAAGSAIARNCSLFGALATNLGDIDLNNGDVTGSKRGFESREGCTINFRNGIGMNCPERGCSAIDGGRANVQQAKLTGCGRAITARNGAHVAAYGADCRDAANWSFEVFGGSIIAANEALGEIFSQAVNTVTKDGIIFFGPSGGGGAVEPIVETPELIAHRGFMGTSYQNTVAAFNNAVATGADSLETDVAVSSDGVMYCFHDSSVDSLTNGTGAFTSLTSAYIDTLQYKAGMGTADEPVRIARFADFLQIAKDANRQIYAEFKSLRSNSDVTMIVQAIIDAGMASRAHVASSNLGRLQMTRGMSPDIGLGLFGNSADGSVLNGVVDSLSGLGKTHVSCNLANTLANPASVTYAHNNGVGWATWTVTTDAEVDQLAAIGVVRVIADVPVNVH